MREKTVPVIFRKYRDGEIVAVFPTLLSDCRNSGYVTSYAHVGQHGAADLQRVVATTRAAKPTEYVSLAKELRRIGYRLKPVARRTQAMRNEFRRQYVLNCVAFRA